MVNRAVGRGFPIRIFTKNYQTIGIIGDPVVPV